MIRVKGRYRDQRLELDHPLHLPEGAEVMLEGKGRLMPIFRGNRNAQ